MLVLDTNILVSALKNPNGKASKLLNEVLDGKYSVVCSEEIFKEYDEVLRRPHLELNIAYIDFILFWIRLNAEFIEPTPSDVEMTDESDRIFYDVARCRQARLVTGNLKHYPIAEFISSLDEF